MSIADHVTKLDGNGGIARHEPSTESSRQVRNTVEQIDVTPQSLDIAKAASPKSDALRNVKGNIAAASAANQATRVSRQRGDLGIYTYWFKSVGWKYIAAFSATQVVIEASQVGSG